jgi:hypothetical protein
MIRLKSFFSVRLGQAPISNEGSLSLSPTQPNRLAHYNVKRVDEEELRFLFGLFFVGI